MKNAPVAMNMEVTMSGAIILENGTPEAFIASISLFSDICPTTITDASRVARGSDRGSMVHAPHIRNSSIMPSPRPLPTRSSI